MVDRCSNERTDGDYDHLDCAKQLCSALHWRRVPKSGVSRVTASSVVRPPGWKTLLQSAITARSAQTDPSSTGPCAACERFPPARQRESIGNACGVGGPVLRPGGAFRGVPFWQARCGRRERGCASDAHVSERMPDSAARLAVSSAWSSSRRNASSAITSKDA